MDDVEVFIACHKRARDLLERYPQAETLRSIIRQLEYLLDLRLGRTKDRSRLREIVIGLQAAREIEPLDLELANLLYTADTLAMKL